MKNSNHSQIQMSIVLSGNAILHEQFSIFRFNKIINEDFFMLEDENLNLDIATTIAFDHHLKKCYINI